MVLPVYHHPQCARDSGGSVEETEPVTTGESTLFNLDLSQC
jgi:hypothetical protein